MSVETTDHPAITSWRQILDACGVTALYLLALVPFLVGWVIGVVVFFLAWIGSAFVEGFDTAARDKGA